MVFIMKTSLVLTIGWVWAASLLRGFDVSRQARCKPWRALSEVANQPSTQSARSPKTPREATWPERHQCLGVHNNVTQPLSHPFVSATLVLRELLSVSWRECGISAPHPSRVLSPADGPLPRLFPCLPVCHFHRLDAAYAHYSRLPVPVAITLCTGIHHPGHWWTIFLLCSGITGIDCDGQWPVNAPFVQCSSIKHHVWPPERDVWSELRFVTKLHELIRLWRRPSFEQNIFVRFKQLDLPAIFKAPNAKLESNEKWIFLEVPSFPILASIYQGETPRHAKM